jgi:hypothetical protein
MDLASFGSFLSGVGSLGGLFGGNTKGHEEMMATAAYNRTKFLDDTKILRTVQDANRSGIHPLYALGSAVSAPSVHAAGGGGGGKDYGAASEGFRKMADALSGQVSAENEARLEAAKAGAKRDKAEADLMAAQAAKLRQKGEAQKDLTATAVANPNLKTPWGTFEPSQTVAQQAVEDAYGGVIGELYGIGRAMHDGLENWKKNNVVPGANAPRMQAASKRKHLNKRKPRKHQPGKGYRTRPSRGGRSHLK